jgi:imidazolonepropionase-like amidohydrolase
MKPMQAIMAATSMGAHCMGLGTEVGVLREGMLADLLVVDGNPLDDVAMLENRTKLRLIMKGGEVIKNSL